MNNDKQLATNNIGKSGEIALTPIREAQTMVMKYAAALLDKNQAQHYATQLAIMARKEPKIGQATAESLVTTMMACVHLNLMPNTPEQYAYIIPYNNHNTMEVQFQLGYKGLIELGYRSGQITSISAEPVFEGDTFRISKGTRRELIHEPSLDNDVDDTDPTKVTHVYAVLNLRNGDQIFRVMSRKQVEEIRRGSKVNSDKGPWSTHWIEMALKTVLKKTYKLAPSSGEDNRLAYAAQADSLAEAGKLRIDPSTGEIIEGEVVDRKANMRAKMTDADASFKKLKESENFNPKPVEAQ